jgi:hypothetical protein
MSVRASWWSLTINNPTPDDRAALKAPPKFVLDMVYQDEIGKKCGTLHIQGCIHTIYNRVSALNEWLPRAVISKAKKPPGALLNYCKKSDTAVKDTQVEWHSQTTAAEIEANEIIEANASSLGFLQALRMLAAVSIIPQDLQDQGNAVEEMYKSALGTLFHRNANHLQGLTGARILPTYKLIWSELLTEAAESMDYGTFPTDDDDNEPEVFTEWRDLECAICNQEYYELCDCRE